MLPLAALRAPQFIAWLAAAGRAAEVACLAVVLRITLLVLAPSVLHFYLLLYAPAASRRHRWAPGAGLRAGGAGLAPCNVDVALGSSTGVQCMMHLMPAVALALPRCPADLHGSSREWLLH